MTMPENNVNPGEEKLLILPLGEESKKITQVISNDTARQVIELLADAPLSASDIAERLHSPISTIVYNLENLEGVGLIRVEKIKYSEKGREVKIYAPVRKLIVVVPEKTDRKSVTDLLRKYMGVILAAVLASSLIEFFTGRIGSSPRTSQFVNYDSISTPVPESAVPLPGATDMPYSAINDTMRGGESYGVTAVAAPTAAPVQTVMTKSIPAAVPSPVAPAPIVGAQYAAPTATQTVIAPAPPAQAVQWGNNATVPPHPQPAPMTDSGAVSNAAPDILTRMADTISAHPGLMFLFGCLFILLLLIIMDYRRRRKDG
ncbi:Helix-turn-helix domain protein [uncultured archaeon]|nr:Helix-turn-helix domain protein [uncultured archaeon]